MDGPAIFSTLPAGDFFEPAGAGNYFRRLDPGHGNTPASPGPEFSVEHDAGPPGSKFGSARRPSHGPAPRENRRGDSKTAWIAELARSFDAEHSITLGRYGPGSCACVSEFTFQVCRMRAPQTVPHGPDPVTSRAIHVKPSTGLDSWTQTILGPRLSGHPPLFFHRRARTRRRGPHVPRAGAGKLPVLRTRPQSNLHVSLSTQSAGAQQDVPRARFSRPVPGAPLGLPVRGPTRSGEYRSGGGPQ